MPVPIEEDVIDAAYDCRALMRDDLYIKVCDMAQTYRRMKRGRYTNRRDRQRRRDFCKLMHQVQQVLFGIKRDFTARARATC